MVVMMVMMLTTCFSQKVERKTAVSISVFSMAHAISVTCSATVPYKAASQILLLNDLSGS